MSTRAQREQAKKDLEALVLEGRINGSSHELVMKMEALLDILEEDLEEEEAQSGD